MEQTGIARAPVTPARSRPAVYDAIVLGGGLVGAALAYGMRPALADIAVLDEGDIAWRASRGNFGLVWVQSKGLGMPAYARWSLRSAELWPMLASRLLEDTGIDVRLEQPGGLFPMLSDAETEARVKFMQALHGQPDMPRYPWKLLDHKEAAALVPGLGSTVRHAIWSPVDGTVNPLKLFRALHVALARAGVDYLPRCPARTITQDDGGIFSVDTPQGTIRGRKLVLAAGLNNRPLGGQIGLDAPVRPQRGQIIALERTRRLLEIPLNTLRQMDEGSWLIADSQEEAGFEDRVVGLPVLATLAERAVLTLPALRDVRIVRSWSALRVMSPDGFPIYQESPSHPGAFVATCHSGVTLAAAHALELAPMIANGALQPDMAPFTNRRFHVQKA